MDPTTLRESLGAAFDESEAAPEAAPVEAVEAAPEPAAEAAPVEEAVTEPKPAAEGRDEKGRFAPKAKPDAQPVAAEAKPLEDKPVAEAKPVEAPKPASETIKPPQSWKPHARERWAALPPEVQQEVARREREIATGMQEAAEARKVASAFRETVAPFEAMVRAEGAEPLAAVRSLFQTAAALRTAPPVHKAQLVAQMVKQFGIPIDALDAALSGEAMPATAQPGPQQFRDPRLDQLLAQVEQTKAARERDLHAKAAQEAEQFGAEHEFFEDVRADMAKLMEAGFAISLPDAYNKAIALHPEIQQVMQQREAAKAAATAQATTQRAKAAASSVRSSPAAGGRAAQPADLRGTIEASISSLAGR